MKGFPQSIISAHVLFSVDDMVRAANIPVENVGFSREPFCILSFVLSILQRDKIALGIKPVFKLFDVIRSVKQAAKFSKAVFLRNMKDFVETAWNNSSKVPVEKIFPRISSR